MAISPRENRDSTSEMRNVRRFTFDEDPASTRILRERLPETSSTDAPELAYRAQRLSDKHAKDYATRYAMRGVFLLPPLLFVVITLPLFVPGAELIVAALSLSVAILRAILFGDRRPKSFFRTAFLPVLAILAGNLLRAFLDTKDAASGLLLAILAIAGLFVFLFFAFSNEGPIGFGWMWLSADPRFSSRESLDARRFGHPIGYALHRYGGTAGIKTPRVQLVALANIAGLLVIGWLFYLLAKSGYGASTYNIWLRRNSASQIVFGPDSTEYFLAIVALFALLGVSVTVLRFALRRAGAHFGHFLTYEGAPSGAPGVLAPPASLAQRRRWLTALAVCAVLMMFTSSGFFFPGIKRYFDGLRVFQGADSVLTRSSGPSASPAALVQAPRIEQNQELINQARSNAQRVIEQLGGTPSTAQAPPTRQQTRPAPAAPPTDFLDEVEAWPRLAGAVVAARANGFLWLLATSVLMGTPLLCLLLLIPLAYLAFYDARLRKRTHNSAKDRRTTWEKLVDRVRDSSYVALDPITKAEVREREHLFLGIEPNGNFPVLLHQTLLREHVYIVGDSGSGKTSLGIMPILKQVMRKPRLSNQELGENEDSPAPVLVLDLKGDNALFQMTRQEAEKRGQPFLFFTPEQGRASHHFNPFDDFDRKNRSLSSFSTLFLDALSLNHGEGYGRGYFTARNRQLLYTAIEECEPESFDELYKHLAGKKNQAKEEAFELVAAIQMLAGYNILSGKDSGRGVPEDRIIQMKRLIQNNEVAYFWLPAAVESISVREIGKLALFCLVSAAIALQRNGAKRKTVYVVVDEFQRLAGENFSILLEQARSFGVSLILANQTLSDLNTPSKDLRPSIRTNTRTKFFFSVTEPEELANLSALSGRELVQNRSRSVSKARKGFLPSTTDTESFIETISPRLSAQDIQRISDHPTEFLLLVSRGSGFTQFGGLPVPVRTEWPMRPEEYEILDSLPWPTLPETPEEQIREGLTVEERPIKEREREAKAEGEKWHSTVAADLSGYFEIRRQETPDRGENTREHDETVRGLFEASN